MLLLAHKIVTQVYAHVVTESSDIISYVLPPFYVISCTLLLILQNVCHSEG